MLTGATVFGYVLAARLHGRNAGVSYVLTIDALDRIHANMIRYGVRSRTARA
jgi:hypothetical protein